MKSAGVVRLILFIIGFALLSVPAIAQEHQPTWKLISNDNISSFDMLTTRSGLMGIDNNGVRVLAKYDNGAIDGIFSPGGLVTSLVISDANTAYFSVKGVGIYKASNGWSDYTLIAGGPNPFVFSVLGTSILANFGTTLYYSDDGVNLLPAGGIPAGDTVLAAEVFGSQIAVAVTGKKLYRSLDGGRNWFVVLDTLDRTNSIYADRENKIIYLGGFFCMRSLDYGATWQTLSSIPFPFLSGPVVGVRDCSGAFYIGPDRTTHGTDMYRSIDQGRFFEQAGPALFSSIRMKKGVVLDRGSTFFWLDSSGLLGVARDGIDSVVTDSVSASITIQPDSGIHNSLCLNSTATSFGVSVSFTECTGIVLDSLKQVKPAPAFGAKFIPGFLGNAAPLMISYTFRATRPGWDTAHYRLKFHSLITGNIEQKFFDIAGLGTAGSPDLLYSVQELDFPPTGLDSVHKLTITITNPGCDTLVIDTMFSTNPAIFILSSSASAFPLRVPPGKSAKLAVSFNPHLEGEYLETLVIESNAGSRNITLRGTGRSNTKEVVQGSDADDNIRIYPNPANNFLTVSVTERTSIRSDILPKRIVLRDQLGREVLRLETDAARTVTCDLRSLADGCYILDLGRKFKKILLTH